MAGSTWTAFAPQTKIRSSEVNANFDWIEGSLVPMNAGSKTNTIYDLGEASNRWRDLFLGQNIYLYNTAGTGYMKLYGVGSTEFRMYDDSGTLLYRIDKGSDATYYFYTDTTTSGIYHQYHKTGSGNYWQWLFHPTDNNFYLQNTGTTVMKCDYSTGAVTIDAGIAPGGNEVLKWDVVHFDLDGTSPDTVVYSITADTVKGLYTIGIYHSATVSDSFIEGIKDAAGSTGWTGAQHRGSDDNLLFNYGTLYGSGDDGEVIVFYT